MDDKKQTSIQPIAKQPHHIQQELCRTRPAYRQGRKLTAVKVYTINDESAHMLVSGVPKLNLLQELKRKFTPYGVIKRFHVVIDYPDDEAFTETYHVHYVRIQSARIAKRFLDGFNFYGGILHVCYAPELENLIETRQKLQQRMKDVAVRIKRHKEDPTNPDLDPYKPEGDDVVAEEVEEEEEIIDDEPIVKKRRKRVTDLVKSVAHKHV